MNTFFNILLYTGMFLGILLGILILLFLLLILRGYFFYRQYGGAKQLFARIHQIQTDENFKTFEKINPSFIMCLIAIEDGDFYLHKGLNWTMFYRSMKYNIKHRKMYLGGSSLTQQLAKNLLFPFKKVLKRKIAELFAVRLLEKHYSKNELLELYINCIEYGENCYGITNAALRYLNKTPGELTFSESLQIISLLPSPKRYAPEKSMELFRKTRKNITGSLIRKGLLQKEDEEIILSSAPFEKVLSSQKEKCYEEMARIAIEKKISLEKPMLLDNPMIQAIFQSTITEKNQEVVLC